MVRVFCSADRQLSGLELQFPADQGSAQGPKFDLQGSGRGVRKDLLNQIVKLISIFSVELVSVIPPQIYLDLG